MKPKYVITIKELSIFIVDKSRGLDFRPKYSKCFKLPSALRPHEYFSFGNVPTLATCYSL